VYIYVVIKAASRSMHSLFSFSRGIHYIVLVAILGFWHSSGLGELLHINVARWATSEFDLTEAGGNPANGYLGIHYGQSIVLFFSNTNDAARAEIITPDGVSYPLSKYTKDQNEIMFQDAGIITKDAVLQFREGISFESRAVLDQYFPFNRYVTVRFSGGNLGEREDQLLIADSSQFFNSPPQLNVSTSTLNQLIKYDTAQELHCSVTSTLPWQVGIQDSKYKTLFGIWPLESNYNLTVPRYILEPSLVYRISFYNLTEDLTASDSFAGLTRSSYDRQILPMVSSYASTSKNYYIKTLGPNLRLRQTSALSLFNQVTRMNVEIESNPSYVGILEFTESLGGTPVWTSLTNTVSFGTNGIGNITLEKSGDLRSQWDKSLFFRLRNSRQPIETSGFIPTP